MTASIPPRVVGIDPSLTSTGLADNTGRTLRVKGARRGGTLLDDLARMTHIATVVREFCAYGPGHVAYPAALAVIEGPSFGQGRQSGTHARAGLWWLIVDGLASADIAIAVVPPATRAMYATGKGNAGKDEVLAAVVKRYPAWDVTGNDIADAVVLAAIGARLLGHPVDDLPKSHLRALAKVTLPTT